MKDQKVDLSEVLDAVEEGIAIVKRVVESHKGGVWVENNPEGGSIFFVLLKKA